MKEVLLHYFLVTALFSIFLPGCATRGPASAPSRDIAATESAAAEERLFFPGYNLSINKPPQEWEMQEDLGEGELVIWLNREAGSIIEIVVSRAARNLSYHNIASEFKRITCGLVQQRSPTVTCVILEEKEVTFNTNEFYLVRIVYQGLSRDFSVKSLVYLHRTDNVVYHFLFMEEKLSHLANKMMQSVVFYENQDQNGISEKKPTSPSLIDACYDGDMETLETLLDAGVDINARNKDGVSALAYASDRGHMAIVKKLLANNADVNARSNIGSTALMNAAYMGHVKIVNMLIASGADVNAKSSSGTTALMNAAAHGFVEIVQILLAHDAYVDASDGCGLNALWNAVSSGHCDVAKLLIHSGADVNAKANDGTTVLMNAAFTGNLDMVKMLLAAGAAVNAKADKGWTALMLAKKKGFADIVRVLIEAGAMEDSLQPRSLYFKG